jgi:anti-anti-sigma factor
MSVGEYFRVTIVELDGEAVVVIAGEIDMAAKDRLWEVIEQARADGRRLVIDLAATSFIDSAGLTVLIRAMQAQAADGGEMVLRSPSEPVKQILDMTGVGDAVTVEWADDPSSDGDAAAP